NPQTGTSLAGVSAASSSGLYGVRKGAVLGIDRGALGKAWAYDIAAQQVRWTSRTLPWPHYFVDLSGIGGSAPPGEDAVLLAVCGRVAPQAAGIAAPACARPERAVVTRGPRRRPRLLRRPGTTRAGGPARRRQPYLSQIREGRKPGSLPGACLPPQVGCPG